MDKWPQFACNNGRKTLFVDPYGDNLPSSSTSRYSTDSSKPVSLYDLEAAASIKSITITKEPRRPTSKGFSGRSRFIEHIELDSFPYPLPNYGSMCRDDNNTSNSTLAEENFPVPPTRTLRRKASFIRPHQRGGVTRERTRDSDGKRDSPVEQQKEIIRGWLGRTRSNQTDPSTTLPKRGYKSEGGYRRFVDCSWRKMRNWFSFGGVSGKSKSDTTQAGYEMASLGDCPNIQEETASDSPVTLHRMPQDHNSPAASIAPLSQSRPGRNGMTLEDNWTTIELQDSNTETAAAPPREPPRSGQWLSGRV
ncbi:hypothetical protein AAE478_000369 [Parahypoxylon ruwenzoriense]